MSAASLLEPADEVGADAVKALPTVLGGELGSCGLRLLCGTSRGLHSLGGSFSALGALAWLGLDGLRLWLDRFRSSDRLSLGWHC